MTSGKSVEFFKPADVTYRSPLAARGQVVTEGGDQDGKEGGKDPKPSGPMKPGEPAPTLNRPKAGEPVKPAPAADPAPQRKVIRTGEIEFEVESFDGAAAAVTKLVAAIKGGFVATVNSDKLPNGKVRGSVVVRVPPEHLDGLLLDLRRELAKGGELKGLRVGSQDVTKHYTDLESRLRAARTMEQRLLEIIKSGKGEIKALLEAEKELGVWRTKIEEFEGELRYLANQVGLSTLTVTLAEKSIAAAVGLVESERVQAGIEVEDVDKAQREALQAVADARGRVTKSELKQHAGGQFNAVLQFEVPHEAAGPLRDRLRQLGNVVRFEADRVQRTEGTGVAPRDGKVRRGETQFSVSLYNLANIAPRETATLRVAATEVPAAYRAIREAVAKAKGRVLNAQLNEQDRQNVSAQIDFDVRRADEGALQLALNDAGEVLSRHVTRAPEGENVTDAKVLFKVSLVGAATITPRETVTLGLEVNDVDQALAVISAHVKEAQGRVINSQVNQEPSGRVTASAHYDVPLSAAAGLAERLKAVGQVRTHQSTRNLQAPEGKLAVARFTVGVSNAELILPKNEGLWAQIRAGLSYSLRGLSLSVSWLIVAVLFVLPWALIVLGVVWVLRRLFGGREPVAAPATTGAANPQP